MQVFNPDDPALVDNMPNDDIFYVEGGQLMTKNQFSQWFNGEISFEEEEEEEEIVAKKKKKSKTQGGVRKALSKSSPDAPRDKGEVQEALDTDYGDDEDREFVHTSQDGAVIIEDFPDFPNGLTIGFHEFIPLEELGGREGLRDSLQWRVLEKQKKVEIVDMPYVRRINKIKKKRKAAYDKRLERELVPDGIKAERVSEDGRVGGGWDDDGEGRIQIELR
jgi:hypothetical protein